MNVHRNGFRNLPVRLNGLGELAENMWWSWNPGARMLFKMLDRPAWKESRYNPDKMLRELPPEILEKAAGNADYLRQYDVVMSQLQNHLAKKGCPLLGDIQIPADSVIAYFSAEYGLHRSLPFYAGGLGFLAGDHLKEGSDLNVPLVGVGFMYPEGYLHQLIREDGWQDNITETLNREAAAINRVLNPDGSHLTVRVPLIEPAIHVPEAGFNMTSFALGLSKYRNAVSKRHGEVSCKMWQSLWPDEEDTIDYITNGVHISTWVNPRMRRIFDKYMGPGWLEDHDNPVVWELVEDIPDDELWKTHYWLKVKLIDAMREQYRRRWVNDRANPSIILAGGTLLDPSVLTLGFARRFATYKRADLIFYDIERLKKILNNHWRPIQIIFAGKAHPADDPGKRILQRVFNASRDPEMAGRIAFIEDYGEQLAQYLVHGVDVWLNTPLPPMEAGGTSGMKAAVNGVPHLSISDGWWIEGYNGKKRLGNWSTSRGC